MRPERYVFPHSFEQMGWWVHGKFLSCIWSIHEVTNTITPCSLDRGVRITPCLDQGVIITPCLDKLVVLLLCSGWVFWIKDKTQLINVHFNSGVSMWLMNLLWFTTSLCAAKIWLFWLLVLGLCGSQTIKTIPYRLLAFSYIIWWLLQQRQQREKKAAAAAAKQEVLSKTQKNRERYELTLQSCLLNLNCIWHESVH